MPFSHKIYKEHNTVVVKAVGEVNARFSIAAMQAVANDKDFEPHFDIIVDLREMEFRLPMTNPLTIKDSLVNMKTAFRGTITIINREKALSVAKIIITMAAVHGIKIQAATSSPLLEKLEEDKK